MGKPGKADQISFQLIIKIEAATLEIVEIAGQIILDNEMENIGFNLFYEFLSFQFLDLLKGKLYRAKFRKH